MHKSFHFAPEHPPLNPTRPSERPLNRSLVPMLNLTVLVAHCDDEFLFMFPAIYEMDVKKIVCVTSDVNNPKREWCKRRREGFFEICDLLEVEGQCLDYSSRFYGLPNAELFKCVNDIQGLIADADTIFTHNAWGEYGHLDHVLCNQVAKMSGKPVLTTDIMMQADWHRINGWPQGKVLFNAKNDAENHERFMAVYRKFGAMGWTYPMVESANVVEAC